MTRPLYEPSPTRTDAVLGYGVDQLQRRPAPRGFPGTEWATYESATNLGTTYTHIDWNDTADPSTFDSSLPTFAINGSSNLEIAKDGLYILNFMVFSEVLAPSVDTVFFMYGQRVSGAFPTTLLGTFGAGENTIEIKRLNATALGGTDAFQDLYPTWSSMLGYADGAIVGGGVSEIQFKAYYEEDEVGVANSAADFRIMISRIGDPWVP